MNKKGKVVGGVIGVVIVLLALLAVINLHTVKILLGNWFSHKEELPKTTTWEEGTTYEHIQYSEVSDTDFLHLYVPDHPVSEPVPIYIMVHGGGFFYGDLESRQAQLFYRNVRDQGYAVATINYRLGSEASYPAAIEDVKAAVRFLRANADQYGLDKDRFAIAGESAGGYLACMTAVTTDEEFNGVSFIGEEDLSEPVSAKVQAVVDFYGCMQFYTFDQEYEQLKVPAIVRDLSNLWLRDITKGTGMDSIEEVWIGKKVSEMSDEEIASYSVPYYVKKNLDENTDLRVIIMHGDADITVPYLQSENFATLMEDTIGKDKVTYHLFPGYGHAADGFYSADTLTWMTEQIGW